MRPLTLWLLLSLPIVADDLVVVTMPTCQPCRTLKRDLRRYPDMTAGHSVQMLEGKEAMLGWGVDSVPTLIRVRDGKEVARKVGYDGPDKLKAWLNARQDR